MSAERESSLAALKYPLVFFGLALLVVEAGFGVGLAAVSDSVLLVIVLSSWMGALFLVSILVVAFLVYRVPTHIMLKPQEAANRETVDLANQKERIEKSLQILDELSRVQSGDAQALVHVLEYLEQVLHPAPTQIGAGNV